MGTEKEVVGEARSRLVRHKERRMGVTKKKVLLLLLGGLALGLSGSPRTSWKIIGSMRKEWKELTKQTAERAINSLYTSKLIGVQENPDGTCTLLLSEKGKKRALTYNLTQMKIERPARWDGLWRIVSSDIPEDEKSIRDDIRNRLLKLGFYELHNSVFVHPFDCFKEIEYMAELYGAREYMHLILATHIDTELHLTRFFRLEACKT